MSFYWSVEYSHLTDVPVECGPATADEIVCWVKAKAAKPRVKPDARPFGPVECDIVEDGKLIRASFRDKHNKRRRFMRLRRN